MRALARYVPGPGIALIGSRTCLLLEAGTDPDLVQELWSCVQSGEQLSTLLDVLVRPAGVSGLPSFALLADHGGTRRVVSRAGVGVAALGPAADPPFPVVTWQEQWVPDGQATLVFALEGAPEGGEGFPSDGGIVLASRLEVLLAPAEEAAALQAELPRPAARKKRTRPLVTPEVDPPEPADLVDAAVELESPSGSPERDGSEVVLEPETQTLAIAEHTLHEQAEPAGSELPPMEEDGPDYGHMFEDTSLRPPPLPEPEEADDDQPPAALPPEEPADVPAAEIPAAGSTPAANSGLIASVPWLTPPPPSGPPVAFEPPPVALAAPPKTAAPVSSEADERTIKRGDLDRAKQPQPVVADRLGPVVHAIVCRSGHLNDPQSHTCRECGEGLPDQEPVTVPRPVLGQLRLSTGDFVLLDRAVVLGRGPTSDADGAARPHLVKVNNPANDVSRKHVTVELDGWHVIVQDLRSTNGTVVALPGQAPQRLRPEDRLMILPGTVVTLAEGVSFTYEAP